MGAMSSRALVFVLVTAALGSGFGCKKPTPSAPPAEQAPLRPLEVSKEGKHLFTHVAPDGTFATVEDPTAVPEGARRLVRVIDPGASPAERRDTAQVYVVDLGAVLRDGKAQAQVMSREAFETGALAQLPPGESSALADAPVTSDPAPAQQQQPEGTAEEPQVTLYGTSWCGACKAARQYLSERKIPFVEKDIERDRAAARELQAKAARLGIRADRVPVLDVRGRLLVGFEKSRLEALLGTPT